MASYLVILFLTALIAGLCSFLIPELKGNGYKLLLVFAGAFLFAVTIIHILPELYYKADKPGLVGLYVLIGFFFQQVLEHFSDGAEHGHIHLHANNHSNTLASALPVLIALSIHAFLEGALLAHSGTPGEDHDARTLLLGIALHKAPAAFALMSIIRCYLSSRKIAVLLLVIFALASPSGMLAGHYITNSNEFSENVFTILFGIVSGSFLHISTTIVFESSTDHHFNARKLGTAVLGALVAVVAEVWM